MGIVRRAIKNDSVVAGGGAIEMELSRYLRDYSRTIAGKEQLIIAAMAKALEVIARQLCDNAGFDATNILNKLRQKHAQNGGLWYGVDVINEDIADNFTACVWEPSIVKSNAITAASEAHVCCSALTKLLRTLGALREMAACRCLEAWDVDEEGRCRTTIPTRCAILCMFALNHSHPVFNNTESPDLVTNVINSQ